MRRTHQLILALLVGFSMHAKALVVPSALPDQPLNKLLSTLPKKVSSKLKNVLSDQALDQCVYSFKSRKPDQVYHIKCGTKEWGLRLFGRTVYANKRGVYRASLAGALEFGPKIVASDPETGFLMWPWLKGAALSIPLSDQNLESLTKLLKKVHAVPADQRLYPRVTRIEDRVINRIDELQKIKSTVVDLKALRRSVKLAVKNLQPQPVVMIHGDLQLSHVLQTTQGIKLIDWGDSGTGDAFDDLAAVSVFFALSPMQDQKMLDVYFDGRVTCQQQQQLFMKKLLVVLHYSLWQLRQAEKGRGLLNQTRFDMTAKTLAGWLRYNGTNSHFTGNPALSRHVAMMGLESYFKGVASEEYKINCL
jgi:thiamine kinase-like enzyme